MRTLIISLVVLAVTGCSDDHPPQAAAPVPGNGITLEHAAVEVRSSAPAAVVIRADGQAVPAGQDAGVVRGDLPGVERGDQVAVEVEQTGGARQGFAVQVVPAAARDL